MHIGTEPCLLTIFESFISHFQDESQLWIHGTGLRMTDVEEGGIEPGDVFLEKMSSLGIELRGVRDVFLDGVSGCLLFRYSCYPGCRIPSD